MGLLYLLNNYVQNTIGTSFYELPVSTINYPIISPTIPVIEPALIKDRMQKLNNDFILKKNFAGIKDNEIKKIIPLFLWDNEFELYKNESFYNFWIDKYRSFNIKMNNINYLIGVFFREFRDNEATFDTFAQLINDLINKQSARERFSFLLKNRVFDLTVSTKNFVQPIFDLQTSWNKRLIEYGNISADSKYYEESFLTFLNLLNSKLTIESISIKHYEILFELLKEDIPHNERRTHHTKYKLKIITSLFEPWEDRIIDPTIQSKIIKFTIREFGDPRLSIGVDPIWNDAKILLAKSILKKWLVGDDLKHFVEYIKNSEGVKSYQWEKREAFWMDLYKKNMISESWLICNRRADQTIINDLKIKNGVFKKGSQVNKGHSAILFKINDITIIDWSHDGAMRMWNANNINAPELYKPEYHSQEDLRVECDIEPISHQSRWEDKARNSMKKLGVIFNNNSYFRRFFSRS